MIKIDTSEMDNKGMIEIAIQGNPIQLATEALAVISSLKQSIKARRESSGMGEVDAMAFEMFFLAGLRKSLEVEMQCMKAECEDIRSADFTSNEEFLKWFRGQSESEDADED